MRLKHLLIACVAIVAVIAVLALGLLCVLCGFTGPYFDPLMAHKEYNASHQGAANVTVDVSSSTLGGGDVKILPSPDDTVRVKIRIDSGTPEYVDTETSFEESDDVLRLKVSTRSMGDEMFNLRSSRSVIEVYLPLNATYDVDIKTFSGDVYVCPLTGGSLVIQDPPYRQYGHISIDGGNYTSVYVKSNEYMANSGGLIAAKYNATNAYFDAAGDIEIDTLQTEGRLKAVSKSGNIRLTLPAGAGFNLNASTGKGAVDCAIPLLIDQSGEGYLKGISAGYPCWNFTIELSTGSGDIKVANK
jgi:DUF4097 and DUF4098 domain-containing protein YvlB